MNEQRKANINVETEKTLSLLRALISAPEATQRNLSKKSGLSLGMVNFIVNDLLKKGLIRIVRSRNNGNKMPYLYILTSDGIKFHHETAKKVLERKRKEYEAIKRECRFIGNNNLLQVNPSCDLSKNLKDL